MMAAIGRCPHVAVRRPAEGSHLYLYSGSLQLYQRGLSISQGIGPGTSAEIERSLNAISI